MEICKQINSNNYNVKYLDIAKNEALKSELTNKHGCVIVRKNKVIAKGYNKYNNEFKHCFSIHAEMDRRNWGSLIQTGPMKTRATGEEGNHTGDTLRPRGHKWTQMQPRGQT